MNCKHRRGFRWMVPGFLVALISLAGISGCHRGGWSDPDRIGKKIDNVVEDLEEDLELRPEQKSAYQALAGKIKSHAVERMGSHRAAAAQLKDAFAQPSVDTARVTSILKEQSRKRASAEEHDALIDEGAAFYRTLDAGQQAVFNKKVQRVLNWHD